MVAFSLRICVGFFNPYFLTMPAGRKSNNWSTILAISPSVLLHPQQGAPRTCHALQSLHYWWGYPPAWKSGVSCAARLLCQWHPAGRQPWAALRHSRSRAFQPGAPVPAGHDRARLFVHCHPSTVPGEKGKQYQLYQVYNY